MSPPPSRSDAGFGGGSFQPGALLALCVGDRDERLIVVLVEVATDTLTLLPLSHETEQATEWDLLLGAGDLGYAAIAEGWNAGVAIPEQVEEKLGRLEAEQWQEVAALFAAAQQGTPPPEDLPVGPAVVSDDDPRLLFQEQEFERARPFWVPASVLAETSSLKALIAQRSESLGLDLVALDDELGHFAHERPHWPSELARSDVDIARVVPVKAMSRLLNALRVPHSRRAVDLVRRAVFDSFQGAAAPAQARLARRRVGVRQASPEPSDAERQQVADQYADRLREEFLR